MHRDRAWRRSQREKKIQRVYTWMRDRNWYMWRAATDSVYRHEELMKTARARHSAPKSCSGWCCGNPRKHFGTDDLNEIRFSFSCEEQYSENSLRKDFGKRSKRW